MITATVWPWRSISIVSPAATRESTSENPLLAAVAVSRTQEGYQSNQIPGVRAQPRPGWQAVRGRASRNWIHSHSMVPGGLLVTSSTTRLTSGTSLVIRLEMLASTSCGSRDQSAVMASSLDTGRSTTGWP